MCNAALWLRGPAGAGAERAVTGRAAVTVCSFVSLDSCSGGGGVGGRREQQLVLRLAGEARGGRPCWGLLFAWGGGHVYVVYVRPALPAGPAGRQQVARGMGANWVAQEDPPGFTTPSQLVEDEAPHRARTAMLCRAHTPGAFVRVAWLLQVLASGSARLTACLPIRMLSVASRPLCHQTHTPTQHNHPPLNFILFLKISVTMMMWGVCLVGGRGGPPVPLASITISITCLLWQPHHQGCSCC